MSSSCLCATYFELTNSVVKNICDKKALGGIMFYQHLLFILLHMLTLVKYQAVCAFIYIINFELT